MAEIEKMKQIKPVDLSDYDKEQLKTLLANDPEVLTFLAAERGKEKYELLVKLSEDN